MLSLNFGIIYSYSSKVSLINNTQEAFLQLIKAGLWGKEACLLQCGDIVYEKLLRLSEEQSVVGLVAAGFDYVIDIKPQQETLLQFIGLSLQIEQRNRSMNAFIAEIVEKMRNAGFKSVLVKGSGIAQCYQRPLWRSCGDIDFFFSRSEYNKVVIYYNSISSKTFQDSRYTKSYGVILDDWQVELHGTMRSGLSSRLDCVIDNVQKDVFYGGDTRSWMNGTTQVLLPGVNSDLFLLFTHFVRHFYHHEFVIRQVCDWCRFLWTYKDVIDIKLLETQLRNASLMEEWKSFAALAVNYLGMPKEALPFYDDSQRWSKKAKKILSFSLKGGIPNGVIYTMEMAKIFPINTLRFLPSLLFNVCGLKIKERLFGKDRCT